MRSPPNARGRSLGIAFSLVAHLLVLAALVFGIRQGFPVQTTRVADVELIQAWPNSVHREPRAKRPTPRRKTREVASPTSRIQTKAAPIPPSTPLAILAPQQTPPPALRLGLGCAHPDFMGLTAEERAACRDRLAARGAPDHDYAEAGIDPKARAAFDARSRTETFLRSPFLSAMPKKGCRPRVTEHDAAAFGKSQPDFTVQATCVVHF